MARKSIEGSTKASKSSPNVTIARMRMERLNALYGIPSDDGNAKAVEEYVSGERMYINQLLRRGERLDPDEMDLVKKLDAATNKAVDSKELYRSVDASAIFGNIGDMQYESLVARLGYGLNQKLYIKDTEGIINRTMGKEITEKGYMSTTKDRELAHDFGGFTGAEHPIVMRIKTNGKARGYDVSKTKLEKQMEQKEVLLKRNTSYKVDKIYGKDGHVYVDVTLTK